MDRLRGLKIFVAVARSLSFTQAARQLGMSRGYVTKYVSWLEESYGVQLLTRTTRSVGLTHAGQALLEGGRDLLERHDQLAQDMKATTRSLSGLIRIGVPPSFGVIYVTPRVADFVRAHPGVQVELCMDTGKADLAAEGLDFSIRLAPELRGANHVARLLLRIPQLVVASPAYLARAGVPRVPGDLEQHDCLLHTIKATTGIWSFTRPDGAIEAVRVKGPLRADFGDILFQAALRGEGIAMHHRYMLDDALERGALQVVLADYATEDVAIHIVYPSRKRMPLRVRALLDTLLAAASAT